MQRIPVDEVGDLLQQPWLATLATYRKDGRVLLSPVWFEWDGDAFVVSLVHGDWKELHLRRDPRASLLIAEEASYPGRALEVWGRGSISPDPDARAILRIATRYLGETVATKWVSQYPDLEWDLLRLTPDGSRALDHRNVPFLALAEPQYPATTEWQIQMIRMPETGSEEAETG
jgi:PPOX class probable F420-dependent enzyme